MAATALRSQRGLVNRPQGGVPPCTPEPVSLHLVQVADSCCLRFYAGDRASAQTGHMPSGRSLPWVRGILAGRFLPLCLVSCRIPGLLSRGGRVFPLPLSALVRLSCALAPTGCAVPPSAAEGVCSPGGEGLGKREGLWSVPRHQPLFLQGSQAVDSYMRSIQETCGVCAWPQGTASPLPATNLSHEHPLGKSGESQNHWRVWGPRNSRLTF